MFDVDVTCVQPVGRVKDAFERSRTVPIVRTTDARDAARGTDIVLKTLLPSLLDLSTSIAAFAPAQSMLTFSLSLCASAYMRSSVSEMERVLTTILDNPHFIPHVLDHFDPFVCSRSDSSVTSSQPDCFVAMYGRTIQAMNRQDLHPGLIMMLVQKFDLNEWLRRDPSLRVDDYNLC